MFKKWLIRRAITWIKELDADEKHQILQMAVKDLFLPIDPDDILHIKNGKWHYLGRELQPTSVERLKQDALALKDMQLWKILKWDVRYHLSRKMYEEGRTKEDFIWGQLATWLWDIMKTRIDALSSLK